MKKLTALFICVLCALLASAATIYSIEDSALYHKDQPAAKPRYCPNNCGCSEISLLERRIAEVEGSIKGFEAAKNGRENIKFSQSEYKAITAKVKDTINSELSSRGLNGLGAGAKTHPGTCGITILYEGSPCIQESLIRHEKIHQEECIKVTGRAGAIGSVLGVVKGITSGEEADYRHGKTDIEFINEEVSAYKTELDYLKSELDKLKQNCSSTRLEFDANNVGTIKGGKGGRDYTCERRRMTNKGSDTDTWKKLKSLFGD